MSNKEVEITLTTLDNGALCLQIHAAESHSPTPPDMEAERKLGEQLQGIPEEEEEADVAQASLVKLLMDASRPDSLVKALNEAWTPSPEIGEVGGFAGLDDEEVLLHTIPLFHRILSCMTSTLTNLDAAFACADLLARLCLGDESTLLLQPIEVLTKVKRLITAKRRETREGALRCIITLIKNNVEYCQCFMDCNTLDFILDQIDYDNGMEVATYACKSVLSLVHLVTEDNAKLETLLSRALPALVQMLQEKNEIQTKLDALQCLEEIRHVNVVTVKLQEDEIVKLLTPLLRTEHPEIMRLAMELFGKNVRAENSEDLKALPPKMAYALLKESYENDTEGLESMRLNLIECLLSAVHRKDFPIGTEEAQFFGEIILRDTKACASKAIDVLVVAWDMHDEMASDLAKSDGFLARLPHVIPVTQAALHIVHSMIQADVVAREAMAKNLGFSELKHLRQEMKDGTSEVRMIVLDIFMKLIDEENRCDDALATGILEEVINWFDSDSVNIKRRCWTMCARFLEKGPLETTQDCINFGLIAKYDILFTDFLDRQKSSEEPIQHEPGLDELFTILQSVSALRSGARAICDTGILSRLLEFVTPTGIVCQEIHDIVMNVLTTLPVKTSRLLAQHCGFDVLAELVKSRSIQLKRLGFEILKCLSFKDCTSYLSDSGIIPQLCSFLHEANPRLKSDTVFVICKMSKFALTEVCDQVVESGSYSALFTASRSLDAECEERKILSKIFQKLKSMEATKKAEKKKMDRIVPRMRSFGSVSIADQEKLLGEINRTARGQSISLPTGRSRLLAKSASTVSVSQRRTRMVSCDSDIAIAKEETTRAPTGRFQKLRSLAGRRRTRHSQA